MIEHDMDFISRMCDPVIVMAEGSVLFEGTSDEVKKMKKLQKVIWEEEIRKKGKIIDGIF